MDPDYDVGHAQQAVLFVLAFWSALWSANVATSFSPPGLADYGAVLSELRLFCALQALFAYLLTPGPICKGSVTGTSTAALCHASLGGFAGVVGRRFGWIWAQGFAVVTRSETAVL